MSVCVCECVCLGKSLCLYEWILVNILWRCRCVCVDEMKHVYYIMVISIILNGWFLLERVEWMILLSDVLMSESRFFTFALGRCAKSVLNSFYIQFFYKNNFIVILFKLFYAKSQKTMNFSTETFRIKTSAKRSISSMHRVRIWETRLGGRNWEGSLPKSTARAAQSINENTYTYILNQFASTLTFNKQPSHKQLLRLIYDLSLKYVLFWHFPLNSWQVHQNACYFKQFWGQYSEKFKRLLNFFKNVRGIILDCAES